MVRSCWGLLRLTFFLGSKPIPFLFWGQGSCAPKPELHTFADSDEAWDRGFMHQAPELVPFPLWFDCFFSSRVWERPIPVYVDVCRCESFESCYFKVVIGEIVLSLGLSLPIQEQPGWPRFAVKIEILSMSSFSSFSSFSSVPSYIQPLRTPVLFRRCRPQVSIDSRVEFFASGKGGGWRGPEDSLDTMLLQPCRGKKINDAAVAKARHCVRMYESTNVEWLSVLLSCSWHCSLYGKCCGVDYFSCIS